MARHRMVAPIVSVKHFIALTNQTLSASGLINHVLIDAVSVGDAHSATINTTEGSIIKAVHLNHWVVNNGSTGTIGQWTAILEKVPAGQDGATVSQLLNLMAYPNKKNVLNTFQGNLTAGIDGANALTYMQGWFKIPKGKQRFGLGDRLILSATPTGQQINLCGMTIYKEYQ